MLVASLFGPRAAVLRRANEIPMPAIPSPLPGIAEHTVEPEGVGPEAVDIGQQPVVPLAAAAVAIGFGDPNVVAPPARRGRAGPRSIFPFRLRRQAIGGVAVIKRRMGSASLVVQPGNVFLRVAPIEADGGPARRLTRIRRIGATMPWNIPFHVQDLAAGLRLVAGLPQESQ